MKNDTISKYTNLLFPKSNFKLLTKPGVSAPLILPCDGLGGISGLFLVRMNL